jgi:hypothetical protein
MAAFPCCIDRDARRAGNAAPAFGDQPSRASEV